MDGGMLSAKRSMPRQLGSYSVSFQGGVARKQEVSKTSLVLKSSLNLYMPHWYGVREAVSPITDGFTTNVKLRSKMRLRFTLCLPATRSTV